MSTDNWAPADEARKPQASRLAEQALEAIRAGDEDTSDRLFAEAERLDPEAVAGVLQADDATVRWQPGPERGPSTKSGPALTTKGTAGAPRAVPLHPVFVDIKLRINGQVHDLTVDTRATLLDALRDHLGLTGTKKGCALGQCGACTVLLNGQRINACLTLAVMAQDRPIVTIEGLSEDGALHPMQEAFIAADAFQCGYCTPGQIMSAVGMLAEGRGHDDDDIREQMSGNICRCGAYANIVDAVRSMRDGQRD
jgi:xanthine dehydrogenase YagT iron-sulfur-binding subunit